METGSLRVWCSTPPAPGLCPGGLLDAFTPAALTSSGLILHTGISQAPSAAEMEGPAIAPTSSAAAGFKAGFFVTLGCWYWDCSEMSG
ncbi:hypothetical protein V6N13_009521 [Hibiscus sabdariffa]|uniref:Uncharacterized protein n=1 Tax=Hibiscus sabdariffa TaxID=183260 RepID=A0ABR2A838_9ROSI